MNKHIPQNILVSSDTSPYSASAVNVAIDMVQKYGGKLSVMTMVLFGNDLEGVGTGALLDEQDREAQQHLDEIIGRAAASGVAAEGVLAHGDEPHAEITATAAGLGADLIVMGRRGRRGLAKLMLGDATTRVIAETSANVLVVPRETRLWSRGILLATDGSENSMAATETALALCQAWQLPLAVVFAVPDGSGMDLAEATVVGLCQRAASLGVDCQHRVLNGRPNEMIAAAAHETGADLIVVGSHGHGAFMSLIHGSVSGQVIRSASCPVLVVRGT